MFLRSIEWLDGKIRIIDQTKLPIKLEYKFLETIDDVVEAIKSMRVRGAPLIGITGALGLALVAYKLKDEDRDYVIREIKTAYEKILNTRPTAVNLKWALDYVLSNSIDQADVAESIIKNALKLMERDIEINRKIAEIGQILISDGDVIMTHCNTGSLATVSVGTALGVIIEAWKRGKRFLVYITETRPLLQGARLTAFELKYANIPFTLICDSAVGITIAKKKVNKIFVGADRILLDGTTYNKVGTFQIAILAKKFNVDFYVVAPTSTIDIHSKRRDVIIEERSKMEVLTIQDRLITSTDITVYNPAFDETPPEYVSAIITEKGIIYPPYEENLPKIMQHNTT